MNTISSLTAANRLPGYISKDVLQVTVDDRIPVKSNILNVLGVMLYDEMLETIKTVLIIFAILTMFELAGICDWWIQLVKGVV